MKRKYLFRKHTNSKPQHYKLTNYTSTQPIDYEPTDTVGAKLNHWEYVSGWLKDDMIDFSAPNTISITQHNIWMGGTVDEIILRNYEVIPDQEGVSLRFLDFTYELLKYKLVSFSDSSFVIKAKWHNDEVFSTFKLY